MRSKLRRKGGGVPTGDPCGGTHFHSFGGREEGVVRAIVAWMKSGKVERVVGEQPRP